MPTYEYLCETCGGGFEKRLPIEESQNLPDCPYCRSPHTRKRLSLFATRNSGGSTSRSDSSSACRPSPGRFT